MGKGERGRRGHRRHHRAHRSHAHRHHIHHNRRRRHRRHHRHHHAAAVGENGEMHNTGIFQTNVGKRRALIIIVFGAFLFIPGMVFMAIGDGTFGTFQVIGPVMIGVGVLLLISGVILVCIVNSRGAEHDPDVSDVGDHSEQTVIQIGQIGPVQSGVTPTGTYPPQPMTYAQGQYTYPTNQEESPPTYPGVGSSIPYEHDGYNHPANPAYPSESVPLPSQGGYEQYETTPGNYPQYDNTVDNSLPPPPSYDEVVNK